MVELTLNARWTRVLSTVYYSFQPIVNIHSGTTYGLECLLRGTEEAGFGSIGSLFDCAFEERILYRLDLALREKAISQFLDLNLKHGTRLFYNLDNRVLDMPDYVPGNTVRLLEGSGINPAMICFELSERQEIGRCVDVSAVLGKYKQQAFRIAIDDFGTGFSGLKLLYLSEPDLIKIDRFFIDSIDGDRRKRLFVTNIVDMAHLMGIKVIAEGIETLNEFYVCREIGCDYVQGFLIHRPTAQKEEIREKYESVESMVRNHRRTPELSVEALATRLDTIPPIPVTAQLVDILTRFRENPEIQYFPVVSEAGEPLGLLAERSLKQYVYSPYGISILRNKTHGNDIHSFIERSPVLEMTTRIEKILEHHALAEKSGALIITRDGRYAGVLSEKALLQILNEREIASALDRNPLSRLPGNNAINDRLNVVLSSPLRHMAFTYFDFDNFKAFNDSYGFRQGDRAILLFADMLRELKAGKNPFAGHIGGDDFIFFSSVEEIPWRLYMRDISNLISRFNGDVAMFYSRKDRERGYLYAKDRNGNQVRFPLVTVSAAVACFMDSPSGCSFDRFGKVISFLKKKAKRSGKHLAVSIIDRPRGNRGMPGPPTGDANPA